jgi:hypothetical protein
MAFNEMLHNYYHTGLFRISTAMGANGTKRKCFGMSIPKDIAGGRMEIC